MWAALLTICAPVVMVLLTPRASHAAPARLLTVLVASKSSKPSSARRAGRAIAIARAERALVDAREQFTRSRFVRCATALERAGARLAVSLRASAAARQPLATADVAPRELALLKQIDQWLGLCLAVQGRRAAAQCAFSRAVALPGPSPSTRVFPPAVTKLYDAVKRGARHTGPRGERRDSCRRARPGGVTTVSLTAAEAADTAFLRRLGVADGATKLLLVHQRSDAMALDVFDVGAGRLVERRETSLQAGRSLLAGLPRVETSAPPARPAPDRAWYKRWWVWAVVGAVIVGAVAIPVAATRPTRYSLSF